ncbi:hypothetical protein B9057_07725 [Aestuarium zhoushanense]|nr:hypothetical protein B9057_07725 [Aestuarium zhoushanense]
MNWSWKGKVLETVRASGTKREAAERLGIHPGTIRTHMERMGLLDEWRRLPADNAFAGVQSRGVPQASGRQERADALFVEAAADYPLRADRAQRWNAIGLLLAAYAITGTINLPRGWVRAAMIRFEEAGLKPPTAATMRWYRSKLREDPYYFEAGEDVDRQLLDDLARA